MLKFNVFDEIKTVNKRAMTVPLMTYMICVFLNFLYNTFFTKNSVLINDKKQNRYFENCGKTVQKTLTFEDNKTIPVTPPKKIGKRRKNAFLKSLKRLETDSKIPLKTPSTIAVVPPLTPGIRVPKPIIIPLK